MRLFPPWRGTVFCQWRRKPTPTSHHHSAQVMSKYSMPVQGRKDSSSENQDAWSHFPQTIKTSGLLWKLFFVVYAIPISIPFGEVLCKKHMTKLSFWIPVSFYSHYQITLIISNSNPFITRSSTMKITQAPFSRTRWITGSDKVPLTNLWIQPPFDPSPDFVHFKLPKLLRTSPNESNRKCYDLSDQTEYWPPKSPIN